MTYRTILVPLSIDGDGLEACLHSARSLAYSFDSTLVGMCVVPPPVLPTPWYPDASVYIGPDLMAAQKEVNEQARARLEAAFRRVCGSGPATLWREAEGYPAELFTQKARTSDLVVAPRGQDHSVDAFEDLLLSAGVPILTIPNKAPDEIGGRVVIGWNGSKEATSAIHGALPFLAKAREVTVVAVGARPASTVGDACDMLHRHGIKAACKPVGEPDAGAGETLLAQAAEHRADLLVMGAYGHTRFREMIFGGATRHVLKHAALPVLFGS